MQQWIRETLAGTETTRDKLDRLRHDIREWLDAAERDGAEPLEAMALAYDYFSESAIVSLYIEEWADDRAPDES